MANPTIPDPNCIYAGIPSVQNSQMFVMLVNRHEDRFVFDQKPTVTLPLRDYSKTPPTNRRLFQAHPPNNLRTVGLTVLAKDRPDVKNYIALDGRLPIVANYHYVHGLVNIPDHLWSCELMKISSHGAKGFQQCQRFMQTLPPIFYGDGVGRARLGLDALDFCLGMTPRARFRYDLDNPWLNRRFEWLIRGNEQLENDEAVREEWKKYWFTMLEELNFSFKLLEECAKSIKLSLQSGVFVPDEKYALQELLAQLVEKNIKWSMRRTTELIVGGRVSNHPYAIESQEVERHFELVMSDRDEAERNAAGVQPNQLNLML